jgi:hypothetical protein
MMIPACVHFCWIGIALPWAYVFAILSAAENSGFAIIHLHHTDALEEGPQLRALRTDPRVRLSRIDPPAYLAEVGALLGLGDALVSIYRRLDSAVMRCDILRAAILYLHGGIYLDLDTITVAALHPLLAPPCFVGSEFVVWPRSARASHSPIVWARHLTLDLIRKLLRQTPRGWQMFRTLERFCFRGVNNAVMGAEPKSPLLADYLRSMLTVPASRDVQPCAFGPHLLQDVLQRHRPDGLTIHQPHVFFPLPPEISEHWFRMARRVRLDAVLSPETRVVHWYASVRTRKRIAEIDPDYVRQHREHQLYSKLVCSCIAGLPQCA